MSEFVTEKLIETHYFYLNILKQASFPLMIEHTNVKIKQFKDIGKNTLDNLKKNTTRNFSNFI